MVLEDKFRRDVRLKITPIERAEYTPPKGIDIVWYPFNEDNDECNASFFASTAHTNPEECRDINDINEQLGKLRVKQDSISDKDEPMLVKNFAIGIHGLVDTPNYDGERDHYRSQLREENTIEVRKDIVDQINKDFERKSFLLPTTKRKYSFNDSDVSKNPDGVPFVKMRFARIL